MWKSTKQVCDGFCYYCILLIKELMPLSIIHCYASFIFSCTSIVICFYWNTYQHLATNNIIVQKNLTFEKW